VGAGLKIAAHCDFRRKCGYNGGCPATTDWASRMSDVTQILSALEAGDAHAAELLLPIVYDELRRLAKSKLAHEKPGQTLDATGLVHEAYLRLVDVEKCQQWDSRGHFFAAAAEAMRRILVESARRKGRQKHGGDRNRVELNESDLATTISDDRLLAIDEALERLSKDDAQAGMLVKLRFFAGFSLSEAADILGMSRTSAYEQWAYARAWLRCDIED
jgi:RNA polymerase sigma factor (TIGR02999 family)